MPTLAQELEQLKSQFDGEIRLDQLARRIYSTDASVYQEAPMAVALPRTEQDLGRLIDLARRHRVGLIPRTAGTSLAGQVVGSGIVVDVSRHFTRVLEINRKQKWVRLQPGVIRNELNMELEPHGLMFGPETATANRAMVGGMLGNNSCGANSIVYGSMREQTIEVSGFLSDGTRVTFGPTTDSEFSSLATQNGRLGQIHAGLRQMFNDPELRLEVEREFPKSSVTRRNTGYALDQVMQASPFCQTDQPLNLSKLIAGSEGTLLFVTELKLQCHDLPPPVAGLLCPHFDSVDQALRAAVVAMKHQPHACELIDRLVLEGAARNLDQKQNMDWVKGKPAAILVVELRGESRDQVASAAEPLLHEFKAAGAGGPVPFLFEPDTTKVWELRKAGLGVVANVVGDHKPTTVIEDTAVAIEDLPDYIAEFNQLLKTQYGFDCVHYAHAGAGEIHLRPVLNLKSEAGQRQFRQIATDVARLVKKWKGSLSGEHGDGRLRGEFIPQMIGQRNYEACCQIKQLFDPENIFNPGKIVDPPPMDASLRFSADDSAPELNTVFDFESTQGFLGAAEMCSGSGDCRKTHLSDGTMCPSYMATRNESDTTRARANVLRQVLTSPSNRDHPLNDQDAWQVLDLCLSCKACKSECPSNVDMAKMKAEFLSAFQAKNGIPFRSRVFANYARLNQLASFAPGLFNWLTRNRLLGRMFRRIVGIHPDRSIPGLHRQTLRRWFRHHRPHENAGSVSNVILFCDEFTNFSDVSIGIETIELLERLGYAVELVSHLESGRAAISKGLLKRARSIAHQNIQSLSSLVSREKPLIGIEPSALLTFRDEYLQLTRGKQKEQARQLAQNCLLIDEFIDAEFMQGRINSGQFVDSPKTIRLHGHCHQKALASLAPTVRMLQLPQNYQVRLIPSGCCGMAGSFGFEQEHFEISNQIGELVLMPTIRQEPESSLIAVTGTSCRHQIHDATGKRTFHPVQLLRRALIDK